MAIKSDWHIHTKYSCDRACMEFEDLVLETKKLGITDFGVSDHFHTRLQEQDIAASRADFDKTLQNHPELNRHFHFGMEATVVSKWEVEKIARGDYDRRPTYGIRVGGPKNTPVCFDFDEEFLEKYKIEYVVAGVHWPMYCDTDAKSVLEEFHRQYMFAATHPATDILAHYAWGMQQALEKTRKQTVNVFLDIPLIPASMKNELKAALLENNVAVELSSLIFWGGLITPFLDSYLEWISELQSSGIKISMGSDCHERRLSDCKWFTYENIDEICKRYGIKTSEFFCL